MKYISLLIILCLGMSFSIEAQISIEDSTYLVSFYDAFNGDNWSNNTNWKSPTEPVGSYYGVRIYNNRVESINLPFNNLVGSFPNSTYLSEIYSLNLADNSPYPLLTKDPAQLSSQSLITD